MNDQNPNDQGQSGSGNSGGGINPAWKPYLDNCPEVLKPQMIEIFKQWDAGVQQKLQSVRNEFAGADKYKDLIASNIDPTYIAQALNLAQQLQADPKGMVERMHQTFKLDYVPANQQQPRQSNNGFEEEEFNQNGNSGYSFANDPAYKQMMSAFEQMQERENQRQQQAEEQYSREQFEDELDALEDKYKEGPFNRILVTAFMGTGLSGDEAVAAYRRELGTNLSTEEIINNQQQTQQNNQQQAPVFMGGGDSGNGMATPPVPNFGDMSKGELNNLVAEYISKSGTSD